ncbi:MAG: thioredoxin family protein [Methylococcales bacterium]|nr:thioredoxin family protein [Methylococcales bacterium]
MSISVRIFLTTMRINLTHILEDGNWCVPCKVLAPYFEKVAKLRPNEQYIKVDVEGNEDCESDGSDICAKLGITTIPHVVVYESGKRVTDMNGAEALAFFKRAV